LTPFVLPPSRIDPAALPPLIMTSDPGSFAHNTLRVRIPGILRETIELNSFPDATRSALEALYDELVGGSIRGLQEDAPDRGFWDQVSAPYIGRTWLDVPWYWAEAFFYRRLLEATCYFVPGPWRGFDPFAAKKETEWAPDAAPSTVDAVLRALPFDRAERFERLLHASLWGNRADLSYAVAAHLGGTTAPHDERSNLLVDDTATVWQHLQGRTGARVALIVDNAGTELAMDLALADYMLSAGLAGEVHLHLKPQPFFVSDAMPADVMAGLAALDGGKEAARALARQIRSALRSGRLRLVTHWSYATSLFYFQLPLDLYRELAAANLVLVKGDANYRRLVGDVHWPPATPFAYATRYFPAPLVALRTFKAELAVGLRPGEAEELATADPDWSVNGRRGVIQANLQIRI
jgi:uncharacterized protein with ATP-grasp and redox domains